MLAGAFWEGEGMLGKGRGRAGEGRGRGEGLPPPYNAIRPVRARLCLEGPTFSIACCAITSPVAKSTCHHTHPSAPEAPYKIELRRLEH